MKTRNISCSSLVTFSPFRNIGGCALFPSLPPYLPRPSAVRHDSIRSSPVAARAPRSHQHHRRSRPQLESAQLTNRVAGGTKENEKTADYSHTRTSHPPSPPFLPTYLVLLPFDMSESTSCRLSCGEGPRGVLEMIDFYHHHRRLSTWT